MVISVWANTLTSCFVYILLLRQGNLAKHAGFHDVSKPKSVQVSNWSKSPLTDAQIRYAAQDAALSLWVLQRLYDGYAPTGVGIETWSASFAGCETRKHLVARCERLDGVTDPTMRSHMKQRLATWTREESDAKAVKAFRKASLALATHDEGVATGAFISISYLYFRTSYGQCD